MRDRPRREELRIGKTLVAVLAIAALVGFSITANVVRKEGWNGLWDRKKDFIRSTVPGSDPALERAEEALRQSPRRQ